MRKNCRRCVRGCSDLAELLPPFAVQTAEQASSEEERGRLLSVCGLDSAFVGSVPTSVQGVRRERLVTDEWAQAEMNEPGVEQTSRRWRCGVLGVRFAMWEPTIDTAVRRFVGLQVNDVQPKRVLEHVWVGGPVPHRIGCLLQLGERSDWTRQFAFFVTDCP